MSETTRHIPILLDPITDFLTQGLTALSSDKKAGVVVDCTLGGGGHTASLLQKIRALNNTVGHKVLAIDQDPDAIRRGKVKFEREIKSGLLEIHHIPFSHALDAIGNRPIYGLMADLGVSSDQIDSESRGFSFRYPASLDMRMNTTTGQPLSTMLQTWSEVQIADLLFKYGEERLSRKIARRIVDRRETNELPQNTKGLAELIASSFPPAQRHGRIHPATRSFQAFRIAINHELDELETLIGKIFPAVEPGGHLAILSFHSLEDRMVKEELRKRELYELPSRKAIQAPDQEVEENPRSRSARLRLAIKRGRVTLK
ncbi:MAG: 16S rRNA (cytosine(1402)-N(4))-methyltransferase RsmH [Bdellovibrionales bacterium]|nr:16S rRNA (cytosine(1402)-N(4))-methyltransferase RsmH [Bdellovibrionales bacterium]